MEEKIKRAIAILEVNKLISSSQTEFVESADIAIKALEKQLEMLRYCDEHGCAGCVYRNPCNKGNICMNDLIITI